MNSELQNAAMQAHEIKTVMQKIARRKPGKKKLVYDKATKRIVSVDSRGNKSPTPFTISPEDADMI